eukprot:14584336-Alexandrium_andersonii.AAC.1
MHARAHARMRARPQPFWQKLRRALCWAFGAPLMVPPAPLVIRPDEAARVASLHRRMLRAPS